MPSAPEQLGIALAGAALLLVVTGWWRPFRR